MVQQRHSYVPGPYIARGAECDRPADLGGGRRRGVAVTTTPPRHAAAALRQQQQVFAGGGDAAAAITLNAALAPELARALAVGQQLAARPGSAAPASGLSSSNVHQLLNSSRQQQQKQQQLSHMWPLLPSVALCERVAVGDDTGPPRRYTPPVQLVVLDSALQRLGPSTPWRYTAGQLARLELEGQQPPLSPGPTRVPFWTTDAGTQTLPPQLQLDPEADQQRLTSRKLAAWQLKRDSSSQRDSSLQQQPPALPRGVPASRAAGAVGLSHAAAAGGPAATQRRQHGRPAFTQADALSERARQARARRSAAARYALLGREAAAVREQQARAQAAAVASLRPASSPGCCCCCCACGAAEPLQAEGVCASCGGDQPEWCCCSCCAAAGSGNSSYSTAASGCDGDEQQEGQELCCW